MSDAIILTFNQPPPVFSTYLRGLLTKRSGLGKGEKLPAAVTFWNDVTINPTHLKTFLDIVNLPQTDAIPLLYPLLMTFPLHMTILGHRNFPLSPFTMLQIRIQVIQHCPIVSSQHVDITCKIKNQRITPKGLELDLVSEVSQQGSMIWESINTYFFRGRFGEEGFTDSDFTLSPFPDKTIGQKFEIPPKKGFKFGLLAGDYNGIHYNTPYAKLMGFKKAFSHAQRSLAVCLSKLPILDPTYPIRLDAALKGPVYYDSPLNLVSGKLENHTRFDLYCGNDPRPCICGEISCSPDELKRSL